MIPVNGEVSNGSLAVELVTIDGGLWIEAGPEESDSGFRTPGVSGLAERNAFKFFLQKQQKS